MLGGAAQSGMASANKIAAENRLHSREKTMAGVNGEREKTLARIRTTSAEKIASQRLAHDKEQGSLDRNNRITTANISASNKTAKSPWATQKLKDENGAEKLVRVNSSTGEQLEYNSSTNSDANNTKLQTQARLYADSVISENQGIIYDDIDFKKYGGVEPVRERLVQDHMKGIITPFFLNPSESQSHQQQASAQTTSKGQAKYAHTRANVNAVLQKNPSLTEKQAGAWLREMRLKQRSQ
jgi:hypothetical protein